MKAKATLQVIALMNGANIVNEADEKIGELKPLVLTGDEGLSTEKSFSCSVELTADEITDITLKARNGTAALVMLTLAD